MGDAIFIPNDTRHALKSSTLAASNTTASNVLFTFTGSILVTRLYGVVTTVLSSNVTAAHWRANDQTNTPAITAAAGTTLSSAAVGAVISKAGLAAAALILTNSDEARVREHATSGMSPDVPFSLTAKNGVVNTIDFRYTTTNTPATGVILFGMDWMPLSEGATVS